MRVPAAGIGLAGCLLVAGASAGGGKLVAPYTSLVFEGVSLTCAPAAAGAGCSVHGCWRNGGGCNTYGCWYSPDGACNFNGCSDIGVCSTYGCPKGNPRPIYECCVSGES